MNHRHLILALKGLFYCNSISQTVVRLRIILDGSYFCHVKQNHDKGANIDPIVSGFGLKIGTFSSFIWNEKYIYFSSNATALPVVFEEKWPKYDFSLVILFPALYRASFQEKFPMTEREMTEFGWANFSIQGCSSTGRYRIITCLVS